METKSWRVCVTYGSVERTRTFEGEAEAIDAYRAMARDAQDLVNAGRVGQARATLSHAGRLLVGFTMLPRRAS